MGKNSHFIKIAKNLTFQSDINSGKKSPENRDNLQISKELQSFMKSCALVFELSRTQVVCGGQGQNQYIPRPHLGL